MVPGLKHGEQQQCAKKRAVELRQFYEHLVAYIGSMLLLFSVDLLIGKDWWFHWLMLGWGIGLLAHAASVFSHGVVLRAVMEAKNRELMKH